MQERSSGQRGRLALGLGAMVAGGALLVGAFPGYAGATNTQTVPTTSTSVVTGNPTCGDLEPEGAEWTEFKIEGGESGEVEGGEYTDGTLTVTIVVRETDDGPVFDWESNIGVDAVFVKGGPGGLLYVYDPESMGDTGLHAPVNPANDKFYGLSHLSFCYDVDQATTTSTTEKDTTTTTEHETSTTSTTEMDTTTTTEHGTTSTTAAGETSTTLLGGTTPTTQPGGELPRTGNNSGPLLAVGAALLCGGTALVAATRKLRHR